MVAKGESERYTTVARTLHWVVAVLVLAQFIFGWWMQEIPRSPPGPRAEAFNLHKSAGLVILALMAARILWRARHAPPAWPELAPWKATLSRTVHLALYAVLIALPVTGYLGSVFSGYPMKFFGLALPAWGSAQPALKSLMSTLHLGSGWLLAGAVLLHLAGAAHHAVTGYEGLLGRMGRRRKTA